MELHEHYVRWFIINNQQHNNRKCGRVREQLIYQQQPVGALIHLYR